MSTCHDAAVVKASDAAGLQEAVAAARKALRDRDDADVPAKLKKVWASSARRLPPPLTKRLLTELDHDDALREEAAALLPADASRASTLFLHRPDGWRSDLDVEQARLAAEDRKRSSVKVDQRIADLERAVEAARAKAKAEKQRADEASAAARQRISESRRDVKEAGRRAQRRADELERHLEQVKREREVLAGEVARLRDELKAVKLAKPRGGSASRSVERSPIGSDPGEIASLLDDVMHRVARDHRPIERAPALGGRLALPPGIAGDSPDAVRWLLGAGHPQVWLIDGHNLAYRLDASRFTDPSLRNDIADAVAALRRRAAGPLKATIVFDTRATVGDAIVTGPGVEVIFVNDADRELERLAGVHQGAAVVISSDEEVRTAADAHGSLSLWSDALVEYLRS